MTPNILLGENYECSLPPKSYGVNQIKSRLSSHLIKNQYGKICLRKTEEICPS